MLSKNISYNIHGNLINFFIFHHGTGFLSKCDRREDFEEVYYRKSDEEDTPKCAD